MWPRLIKVVAQALLPSLERVAGLGTSEPVSTKKRRTCALQLRALCGGAGRGAHHTGRYLGHRLCSIWQQLSVDGIKLLLLEQGWRLFEQADVRISGAFFPHSVAGLEHPLPRAAVRTRLLGVHSLAASEMESTHRPQHNNNNTLSHRNRLHGMQ